MLARLALSAVCRLTPLSPEEVADLKLAITEAANDFVDEGGDIDDESRLNFSFHLGDDRLVMELEGTAGPVVSVGAGAEPRDHRGDGRRGRLRRWPHAAHQVPERDWIVCRAVLQPVAVGHKSLADYTHLAGRPLIEEIRELAEDLEGLQVLHLSATAFGGGVSEILYTLIPLMNDVGIEAEWQVMLGREEFYNATKRLHNALQGNPDSLTDEEWEIYERYNEMNAKEIEGGWDVIIVHDPQPAGDPPARAGEGADVGLALPHRPLDAQPGRDRAHRAARARVRRVGLPPPAVRPGRARRSGRAACTSARRRSTRCRRRTWRSRPRTPRSCATSSASTWTGR